MHDKVKQLEHDKLLDDKQRLVQCKQLNDNQLERGRLMMRPKEQHERHMLVDNDEC